MKRNLKGLNLSGSVIPSKVQPTKFHFFYTVLQSTSKVLSSTKYRCFRLRRSDLGALTVVTIWKTRDFTIPRNFGDLSNSDFRVLRNTLSYSKGKQDFTNKLCKEIAEHPLQHTTEN